MAGLIRGGDSDKDVYVVNKEGALWLDLGGAEEEDVQREADTDSESDA